MSKAPNIPGSIEVLAVEQLVPYARNSRTHSEEQVAQIAASIREFGFTNPVLINAAGGIIAGHGRVMGAKAAGLKSVPCIRLSHLTPEQERAYVIADNQLALNAGWDKDLLALELRELGEAGFALDLLGFDSDALEELLKGEEGEGGAEGLTDPDDAPAPPADPTCQPGQLWIMGGHRLLCGDSTSTEQMARLVGDRPVDMWLTDPPYNVAVVGGSRADTPEERKAKGGKLIQNDSMADEQFRAFLCSAYLAADSAMKPGAAFYIWHADSEGYNFRGAARDAGWKVRQCLIWRKNSLVLGRQDYHWQHEPCLYGWKEGAGHLWASDRKQTTILEFDRPSRSEDHPTMKPVALFEYQLLNNTKGGDIVLDSFGGSGTTLIAAERHGRLARIMELDPRYCDVILRRWQAFTGQQATLEATGEAFDDLAAAAAQPA